MKCEVEKVLLHPEDRLEYTERLLELDGLGMIEENKNGIYCAVPLTGAPPEKRKFIEEEHEKIKHCINKAGLEIYDPKDAGMNPWLKIEDYPQKVYDADTFQLVKSRFFEFTNIYPSTGAGIEQQKAIMYVKIPVIVTKSGIFTSRMSTGARRIILIEYNDAQSQKDDITSLFKTLREFEPGVGMCRVHGNTLIGYSESEKPVCLPGLIQELFPVLVYDFNKYIRK
ncbi:MAG: hypothetical protein QW412_01965 [Candidatus Aenigmatarchaeota archaeon]